MKDNDKLPCQAAFFKDKNPSKELIEKVIPEYMRGEDIDTKNKRLLYGLYQLDWMSKRGFTLDDMIKLMIGYCFDGDYIATTEVGAAFCIDKMFSDWEQNSGFDGSIWVCFEEFIDAEFTMVEYMEQLIERLQSPDKRKNLHNWYSEYVNV